MYAILTVKHVSDRNIQRQELRENVYWTWIGLYVVFFIVALSF